MKKLLIALAGLAMMSASAVAQQQPLSYFMLTSPGGAAIRVTEPFVAGLNERYTVDFRREMGCGGRAQLERHTGPALLELPVGQYWQGRFDGSNNCVFDLTKVRWITLYQQVHNICVRSDSPIRTMNDYIAARNVIFANAPGTPGNLITDSLNRLYGANIRSINLGNSNVIVTALLAGDVQAGFLLASVSDSQVAQGNIRCISTTDVNKESSLKSNYPRIPEALSTFRSMFAVGAVNMNDQQLTAIIDHIRTIIPRLPTLPGTTRLSITSGDNIDRAMRASTVDLLNVSR